MGRFKKYFSWISNRRKKAANTLYPVYNRTFSFARRWPLITVIISLLILLVLIVLGNILRGAGQEESTEERVVKEVEIYELHEGASVTMQGQIEKSGIVTIQALSGGVVQEIEVKAGDTVKTGERLVSISTSYEGGSVARTQRQLAGTQYQNTKDTLSTQKEIIAKQRELALKQDENTDELRDISEESIERTENLINQNRTILDSVNSTIETLEDTPTEEAENALLMARQSRAQIQSSLNQLESGIATTRYETNDENPPAEIEDITKEITLKQLDIQEKALELSLITAGLQLQIARIQEEAANPAAPFGGIIERVYVKKGQVVNPGTPLLVLHGDQTISVVVKIPFSLTKQLSPNAQSTIELGEHTLQVTPQHISTDVTDGSLATVTYALPDEYQTDIASTEYVTVTLPLITHEETTPLYIPIDAVHQTRDDAYVYVVNGDKAKSIPVTLGIVQGNFVEVAGDTLNDYDYLITSRTVLPEDFITIN